MIKYSEINHACYNMLLNYKKLPTDLIEISKSDHDVFMGKMTPMNKMLVKNKYPFEFENIPPKSLAQLEAEYTSALDAHLNSRAKARGYDSIHTAALRATVPSAPYYAEGLAYFLWMDACNEFGYQVLKDVKSGAIPLPTVEEFISSLPVLELP